MNKHESLVRQIAEEMALTQLSNLAKEKVLSGNISYSLKTFYESTVSQLLPAASIAVKHMADAYLKGTFSNGGSYVESEMKENGLLPEQDLNPAGEGGNK